MKFGVFTKAIAAFIGAGGAGGLSQLILYSIGWVDVPPEVLQSIVTGLLTGVVAALTVGFSAANTITTPQIVASAKSGELAVALAGTEGKTDAQAVAEAIAAPPVRDALETAGVLVADLPKKARG